MEQKLVPMALEPEQALKVLNQVTARVPLVRADNETVKAALITLASVVQEWRASDDENNAAEIDTQ